MGGWIAIGLGWLVLVILYWAFLRGASIVNERWDRAVAEIPEECELCGQRHTDRTRYRCVTCGFECCAAQVNVFRNNLYHIRYCGSVPVWCGVTIEKDKVDG
jgi:hypothetical protein